MTDSCPAWRAALGELAVDALDDAERERVEAHLLGCAGCTLALVEIGSAVAALRRTPSVPPAAAPIAPGSLVQGVVRRVRSERRRRRRRRLVVAGALSAVAVAAAVPIRSALVQRGEPAGTIVELRAGDLDAIAVLHDQAWGTQIEVSAAGFEPGRAYAVWLELDDGSRSSAGGFTGADGVQTMTLASPLPPERAVAIGISEAGGPDVARVALGTAEPAPGS